MLVFPSNGAIETWLGLPVAAQISVPADPHFINSACCTTSSIKMADDLALATIVVAIVALALTISPTSTGFLVRIFSTILRTVWPSLGRCEALG